MLFARAVKWFICIHCHFILIFFIQGKEFSSLFTCVFFPPSITFEPKSLFPRIRYEMQANEGDLVAVFLFKFSFSTNFRDRNSAGANMKSCMVMRLRHITAVTRFYARSLRATLQNVSTALILCYTEKLSLCFTKYHIMKTYPMLN